MDHYPIQKDGEVVHWPEKKLRRKLRANPLLVLLIPDLLRAWRHAP